MQLNAVQNVFQNFIAILGLLGVFFMNDCGIAY